MVVALAARRDVRIGRSGMSFSPERTEPPQAKGSKRTAAIDLDGPRRGSKRTTRRVSAGELAPRASQDRERQDGEAIRRLSLLDLLAMSKTSGGLPTGHLRHKLVPPDLVV